MTNATTIKKISPKTVTGNVKSFVRKESNEGGRLEHDGDKLAFMVQAGICSSAKDIKTGSTDYGDWVAFGGRHTATSLVTGEVYDAPVAFLPDMLEADMLVMLREHDLSNVEYAFEFILVRRDELAVGYAFEFKSLMKVSENDPLQNMRKLLDNHINALPSPEPVPAETEVKPAKAAKKVAK